MPMEKLLNLLNEYEEKRIKKINSEGKLMVKLSFNPYTEESLTSKAYRSCWLEICSKYYGFIKWLENENKIDYEKVRKGENSDSRWDFETIQPEYFMIMLLSVQDNPIDFLISILK